MMSALMLEKLYNPVKSLWNFQVFQAFIEYFHIPDCDIVVGYAMRPSSSLLLRFLHDAPDSFTYNVHANPEMELSQLFRSILFPAMSFLPKFVSQPSIHAL